jgi:hypothetical protein
MKRELAGLTVDFLIPQPLRGSGGHRTIYSNAGALSEAGARVTLHFEGGGSRAIRKARGLFETAGMSLSPGWPSRLPASDIVIATTWQSALAASRIETGASKAHFAQDYECWFYPRGDDFLGASRAHDLSLETIVIGRWLPTVLWPEHRLGARVVPFTADLERYRPGPGPPAGARAKRVVAMYQPEKPRRCPELMAATLARLLRADPAVEVTTVGSRWSPRLGRRHRHLGVVRPDELARLYRTSDVGLSLSASNPSRAPFEMMASGLPVVEIGAENTIYDLPEAGCMLAHPDPVSLCEALQAILGDPGLGASLSENGAEFMASRVAVEEHAAFVEAVASIAAGEEAPRPDDSPLYGGEVLTASRSQASVPEGRSRMADRIRKRAVRIFP